MEKRMYFFVPYQLTGIQQGIQCGHAVEQYAQNYKNDPEYMDYVKNHRTWIVLNGGTTNSNLHNLGSLNHILIDLRGAQIKHGYFHEPDLNNSLTAVCFLCDERVYDFVKYPDYIELSEGSDLGDIDYEDWLVQMGGDETLFLRELIRGKRLA